MFRFVLAVLAMTVATPAFAAANLKVAFSAPAGLRVYQNGTYTATVSNNGNKAASAVSVQIQLPKTATSPQVYVLGTLGAKSNNCTLVGTKLSCTIGTLAKGASSSVFFNLAIPYATVPAVLTTTASTTSVENTLTDNSIAHTASLATVPVTIAANDAAVNDHCTGQGLTSFFECTLFPSSISSHDTTFNTGGTISFVNAPGYTGTWSQPSPDRLVFQYFDNGALAASFDGRGVNANCFEGKTTFPGSAYVSMYEVCF